MISLYKHQEIALSRLRLNDSFALFMEQGTGKTIPTLIRVNELLTNRNAHNALIVCPKAVIGSWERDLTKLGFSKDKITIINYDKVWRNDFDEKHFDIIVLDEAHKIKCPTSKRTKALLKMSLSAKYRYILTGTPISNGQLENVWAEMTFLAPVQQGRYIYSEIFGNASYYKFLDRYCVLNQWHKPYKYVRVSELQNIMSEYSYRVLKNECLDLPDKLPDEIWDIEMPKATKSLYDSMHEDSVITDLELIALNSLQRMTYLRELCAGYIKTDTQEMHEYPNGRIPVLRDFLEDYEKKLVIFCEFTYSIRQVEDLCRKLKKTFVTLDGHSKDKTIWKKFQNDPSVQIIICQYQSANAGIDLFAADTMIFYEPTLSSNVLEQCKDRIHRIGQTHKCSYIHMLTVGTIEKAIYRALCGYRDFGIKLFEEYMSEYRKGGAYGT